MRTALFASLCLFASCDSFLEANPLYCDGDHLCSEPGTSCNLARHRCELTGQPGGAAQLTRISPTVGAWDGGTDITVTGVNFQDGMIVQFDGTPLVTRFVSATELHVSAPPSSGLCGASRVTVRTADGNSIAGEASFRHRLANFAFTKRNFAIHVDLNATSMVSLELNPTPDSTPDFLIALNAPTSIARLTSKGDSYVLDMAGTRPYSEVLLQDFDGNQQPDSVFRRAGGFDVFQDSDITNDRPYSQNVVNSALAFGDANSDQFPDLFVFDTTNNVLSYLFTPGSFGFGLPVAALGTNGPGNAIAAADLDGDGNIDLAAAIANGELDIGLGKGGVLAQFDPQKDIAVPPAPLFMQALDVDGDGAKELIIASNTSSSGVLTMVKKRGNIFEPTAFADTQSDVQQMLLHDMDCDGLTDIVLYYKTAKTIDIFFAQSGGGFANKPTQVSLHDDALALAITPIRTPGGRPDIAIVNSSGDLVFADNTSN